MTLEFLDHAGKWIAKMGVGLSVFLIIIWPLVTVSWGVFRKAPCCPRLPSRYRSLARSLKPHPLAPCSRSKSLYTIWASVAFVWGYVAAIIIIALPVYESFDTIMNVLTCNTSKKQAAAAVDAKAEIAKA